MSIFVIGDLHLSFSTDKPMDIFGDNWEEHYEKIKADWISKVKEEDLVLLKESYQPLFYYLGLKYGYKIEPALFTFFFLLPNQQVKMDLKEIIQETIEKFYSLIEEMFTRKDYPPRKNLYCQDCVFDCPLKWVNWFFQLFKGNQTIVKTKNETHFL